jgi:hypothetical protein
MIKTGKASHFRLSAKKSVPKPHSIKWKTVGACLLRARK